MYVVRNTFTAKPGQASKLAAMLKELVGMLPQGRVLTDMTGAFNQVVMEYEIETLADYESRLQQYATDPAIRSKMAGYTDLWLTGTRELYRVA